MAAQTSSTSPPPPLIHPIKYDVFLSFRGPDTRTKFTDHLYNALQVRKGIPTFRDSEQLEKGQDLSQLFEAIEKSKIAVVILSSNYASSTWCLREVAKIVECRNKSGLIVLPVFYEIEPAQVRYQTGNFKKYFDKHEQEFKDSIGRVEIWRQALAEVAGLIGWDLKDRFETTVIEEIVKCVDENWKLKFNLTYSNEDSKDFVAMDRVREVELDLDIKGLDKIGVIGICGMPGVGKTRIAKVVFRRNWHHFEANSFIANVGERRKKNGLLHIQNQLYHDLLDSKVITLGDVPAEKRKLCHKKVLLILDGVTELEFILELVGVGGEELINWFGPGSRIIITTIDEKLLKDYEAKIHKVDRLTENESRLLFFRKAFKKDHPLHDYDELDFKSKIDHPIRQYAELSYKFVDLADGLPLAIVALGNLLLNGTLDQWKAELGNILEANNYTDDEKTYGILKVCIDGLRGGAKEIFLDIACFFKGDDKRRAERIFESCGHNPVMNLDILLKKSLVTIVGGKLWMHDLLQETGQKMVIGESKSLGKRSKLWYHKEAISVFKQDKGTSAVRGIFLSSPRPGIVPLKADSFSKMDFLRLLKIKNVIFSGCLEYDLSNDLRLLEWHGFPSTSLPSNFEPEKLVELHLPQSQIKQLWEGITTPPLEKLVIMDLSDCTYLTSTPDFQSVPNLESLILKGCTRLSEVHLPVGDHLQRLILLTLEGCESLSSLPDGICSLRSLTTLILSGCSKLANLPEKIGENMKQLSQLDLEGTTIKELPASIKNLTGLIRLNLRDCKNLASLPAIICSLTKLQVLNLSGCSKLDELPEKLGSLVGLKELDASRSCRSCIRQVPSSILLLKDLESLSFHGCGGLQLPASFSELDSLTKLDLSHCKLSDEAIPDDLYCLTSLNHLNLSGNSLVSIPKRIINLSKLEVLLLDDCTRLRSLPDLPPSIRHAFARNCPFAYPPMDQLLSNVHLSENKPTDPSAPPSSTPSSARCDKVWEFYGSPKSSFSSWETGSTYSSQIEPPSPVCFQSSSSNGSQNSQSMQIVPLQNKGSLKVLLLHGNLDIWVYKANNLPNMDMFHKTIGYLKFPGTGSNKANGQSNRRITSDPYVSISVANAVIGRTYVISNSEHPVWTQHFNVPVAHYAAEVHFVVKDSDLVGSQLIGVVAIPVEHIYLGARVEGIYPILKASGKPCKPGAVLSLSIQYTPIERLSSYHNGVGAGPDYYGVPGTYFPPRTGGKVTLYQDAHVPDGCLPNLILDGGMPYVHGKCWNDIFDAIRQARRLIYIAGWSVWHNVRLVRDGGGASNLTIGDLLRSKSQEGVRVLLLVWEDPTSSSFLGFKTDGILQTHDEEIRRFFKPSSVQVLLCPRTAGKQQSWVNQREVGTICTHHQKTVIVDADAGHNMRKIVSFVGGFDLCDGRYDTPNHDLFGTLQTVHKDDYHNPTYTGSTAGCPREPWHDLHSRLDGPAAYDVLANFEERWLKASKPQGRKKLKKSYNDSLLRLERIPDIIGASRAASTSDNDPETWHVQIFRSIDSNSVKGFPKDPKEATSKNLVCGKNVLIDMSIHSAYVKAIRSAQHFIYIENQYFIGSSYNWSQYKDLGANNLIPMEIALKIAEKIRANQRFVAYIVIPMWPEGVPTGAATQRILFWQHKTMQMMYETIYKALVEMGLEGSFSPLDYLNFFCLGKREAVDGKETSVSAANTPQALGQKSRRFMIYVHSKGMIVDDEYVIVGSANINQCSMEGIRDTEIAMGSYQPHHTWASNYSSPRGQIFGYRMSLWAEHTGTIEDCFTQPESLDCVRRVRSMAEMNWKQFAAEDVTEMKGHLLKYPVEVDRKGKVTSHPGCENFPDVGGNITGSLFLAFKKI